jgi:Sprouty protein (Spry)
MLRGHQNHQSNCELDEGTSLLTSTAAHSFYSPDNCETAELEYEINGDEDLANDFNQGMQVFKDSAKNQLGDDILSIDSSYVRFSTKTDSSVHDYCYPTMKSRVRRESSRRQQARAKRLQSANLNSPCIRGEGHVRCVYCGELFSSIEKKQTMCVDAPDNLRNCIDVVTCACMADSIAYHCFADEDGDYEPMCSCTSSQNSTARWALVVLLSIVLPCLCCFWPLMGCRRCLRACGCCRTSHRAV